MAKIKDPTSPTWRIVAKNTIYSKKKGAHQINVTLIKDVTYQECLEWMAKNHPGVKITDNKATIKGLLYPNYITIK